MLTDLGARGIFVHWRNTMSFNGYGFEEAGLKDVAEDINERYGDSIFFEDDGEWYDGWKEFKVGSSISWSTTNNHREDYPKSSKEAVTEFFDQIEENLKETMMDKFGQIVSFKLREPMHIFPDPEITKYIPDHVGFYGWVTVVVPKEA